MMWISPIWIGFIVGWIAGWVALYLIYKLGKLGEK